MYKLLLCVRYLQTRYLAFICIVSVMLGVATLIVVNAVMSGFSTKLKDRLHGVLSDIVIDTVRHGVAVLTQANIGTAVRRWAPRQPTHDQTGAASLYAAGGAPVVDRIAVAADDVLRVTVANGGTGRRGAFLVTLAER